mgnify:CR=1 FL=1|tara:strand:- start:1039 stop:1347 length:309 start_codon:yes stop_codon:yes gene_type:complete
MDNGSRFLLFLLFCFIGIWIAVCLIEGIVICSVHCCGYCINCLVATERLVEDTQRKITLRRPINCVVIYPVVAAQELPHYEGDTPVTAASTICDADIIIEED